MGWLLSLNTLALGTLADLFCLAGLPIRPLLRTPLVPSPPNRPPSTARVGASHREALPVEARLVGIRLEGLPAVLRAVLVRVRCLEEGGPGRGKEVVFIM